MFAFFCRQNQNHLLASSRIIHVYAVKLRQLGLQVDRPKTRKMHRLLRNSSLLFSSPHSCWPRARWRRRRGQQTSNCEKLPLEGGGRWTKSPSTLSHTESTSPALPMSPSGFETGAVVGDILTLRSTRRGRGSGSGHRFIMKVGRPRLPCSI